MVLVADADLEQPGRILRHDVGVGLDLPADDDLAEPEGASMTIRLRSPVDGSAREHHAGSLGVDHALHDDRDRRLVVMPRLAR